MITTDWEGVGRPTLCIDFDGVLNVYDGNYHAGPIHPPAPGVRQFLEALNRDYLPVILTARDTDEVWSWLIDNALEELVDGVTNEKPPAIAYIDDRAICHAGDFRQTLGLLAVFQPHWAAGRC